MPGLAGGLRDIARDGLPAATSRRSIKRTREERLEEFQTSNGPLLQAVNFPYADGSGRTVNIPVLHPAATLTASIENCQPFAEFSLHRLQVCPSSFERPWRLVIYSDAVSPGNQLKHVNNRKLTTDYFSFAELGSHALAMEHF